MSSVFTVMLMICGASVICNKDTARLYHTGYFVNAGESKTPCEDWLLAQLEYNSQIKAANQQGINFHFECKPKE
jgi:hypothetical protein